MNLTQNLGPRLICIKGACFLLLIAITFTGIILDTLAWRRAIHAIILVWSSARFYYFLFYVLERYVDPTLNYSGLGDMARKILAKSRNRHTGHDRDHDH